MTLTHSILAALNRPVCAASLADVLSALVAPLALVGGAALFLAVCINP